MTERQRKALMGYIDEHGITKTAAKIGVAKPTLANVLAALPVQPGSRLMVEQFAEGLLK